MKTTYTVEAAYMNGKRVIVAKTCPKHTLVAYLEDFLEATDVEGNRLYKKLEFHVD